MPKYELMYIIGSETSDDEIPKIVDEVKKIIEASSGLIEKYEDLGKKKLAYPVKKSRIGHYILINFSAPAEKLSEIEHRIRTTQNIIRHLMVKMDEALRRQEKDKAAQAKLKITRPQAVKEKAAEVREKKIEIDLDKEIEKALESPDELK